MGKKVTSIEVWEADRSAMVPFPDGVDLVNSLDSHMHIGQRIGESPVLRLHVIAGCPAATSIEGDGKPYLRDRRTIRRRFDDGSFDEWRIKKANRDLSGEQVPSIEAEAITADLASATPRRVLTSGFVDYTLFLNNRTAQQALDELISSALDVPSHFEAGTVDAGMAALTIHIAFDGSQSHMDGLRQITEQLRQQIGTGEVDFVWNGATSKYTVNIVTEVGWSAAERTAGTPDPTKRPIEVGPGTKGNRRKLVRRSESNQYFSRVVPLAGPPEETVSVGQAAWSVASGSGTTALTLNDDPIWADGVLIGMYFGNDADGFKQVTGSTAPNQITLATLFAGTQGRFALDALGTELTYLAASDEAAGGRADRRLRRTDVAPFDNIIDTGSVSADLSEWSTGMPVGVKKVGTVIVTQVTDSLYVKHGTSSAKVQCDTGEGIRTINLALEPTSESPWHSAWVHLYVEQGQIKLELEDSAGTVHPVQQVANSSVKNLVAIAISGMDPVAGNAKLRVIATQDTTIFYLDAWTLTRSASAYEFAPLMGPRALWKHAAQLLNEEGGILNDAYEGHLLDVSEIEGAGFEPIELGSHVLVKDSWNGTAHGINFSTRVVEVAIEEDAVHGPVSKRVRLSRLRKDFRHRFAPPPPNPKLPEQPYIPKTTQERIPTYQVGLSQSGPTVTVTITFNDPDNLISLFEYRTAVGRNLDVTDSWIVDTEDSPGVYSFTVSTVEAHDSFWQIRFTLTDGTVITSDPVPADEDTSPRTTFDYVYVYNPSTGFYEISVLWEGLEDTSSVRVEMTSPAVVTKNQNDRTGQVLVYATAAPGATVSLRARGYSGANQTGTPSPQDWTATFALPTKAPGVDAGDIIGSIDFDQVLGAAASFSTTGGRFYVNDFNHIRWEPMNLRYNNTTYSIASGSALLSSVSVPVFIYFDSDNPGADFQSTTDFSTAVDNKRFVVCMAWRSSDSTHNATYTPVVGTSDEAPVASYDQLITNSLNAVKASIASLDTLNINTGNLTVNGVLTMSVGGILKNAGQDWYIDDDGFALNAVSLYQNRNTLKFYSGATRVGEVWAYSTARLLYLKTPLASTYGIKLDSDEGIYFENGTGPIRFFDSIELPDDALPGRPIGGYYRLFATNNRFGIVPQLGATIWAMVTDNDVDTSGWGTTPTRWLRVNVDGVWYRVFAVPG